MQLHQSSIINNNRCNLLEDIAVTHVCMALYMKKLKNDHTNKERIQRTFFSTF